MDCGQEISSLYVILKGEVCVMLPKTKVEKELENTNPTNTINLLPKKDDFEVIRKLHPKDYFGANALLST